MDLYAHGSSESAAQLAAPAYHSFVLAPPADHAFRQDSVLHARENSAAGGIWYLLGHVWLEVALQIIAMLLTHNFP